MGVILMERWVKTITNILRHPEYPQIKGFLQIKNKAGEAVGKCALGEINCQMNVGETSITDDMGLIMKACKVPEDLCTDRVLPSIDSGFDEIYGMDEINKEFFLNDNIQDWIWKLNDAGYTYEQIVEFLEATFE